MNSDTQNYLNVLKRQGQDLRKRALDKMEQNKSQVQKILQDLLEEKETFAQYFKDLETKQQSAMLNISEDIDNFQNRLLVLKQFKEQIKSQALKLDNQISIFEPELGGKIKSLFLNDYDENTSPNMEVLVEDAHKINALNSRLNLNSEPSLQQNLVNLTNIQQKVRNYNHTLINAHNIDHFPPEDVTNFTQTQRTKKPTEHSKT